MLRSDGNTRWMRVDLLFKWFLCVGIGIVGFWTGHCGAYEPWKGEPTVKLNVRQGPGSGNPVITQIDEGATVTITDEKEGWYKVVIEEDAYGFIGWVFGKYIRESKPISQTSSGPDIRNKENTVTGEGPATASGTGPIGDGPPSTRQAPGEGIGRGQGAPVTYPPASEKGETHPQTRVQRPETPTGQPSEKNTQEMTAAVPDTLATASEAAKSDPSWHGPSQGAEAMPPVKPAPAEATSRDVTDGPHSQKGTPLLIPSEAKPAPSAGAVPMQDRKEGSRWRGVLGIMVKLVVVAFSCLALIFAYRAWQMASTRDKGQ